MSQDWYSILWFLVFGFGFFYLMRMGGCGMHAHGNSDDHASHSLTEETAPHEMDVKDPVCGRVLGTESAPSATRYEGKMYYFHSKECHDAFWKDPTRYAKQLVA